MSGQINVKALRKAATRKGAPLMLPEQSTLLALLDAVEAAHHVLRRGKLGKQSKRRIKTALSLFDFGEKS